jgi:hypothetical protein
MRARCCGSKPRQTGQLAAAASIARRIAAAESMGTVPISSPVAGLQTSLVSLEPTQAPAT